MKFTNPSPLPPGTGGILPVSIVSGAFNMPGANTVVIATGQPGASQVNFQHPTFTNTNQTWVVPAGYSFGLASFSFEQSVSSAIGACGLCLDLTGALRVMQLSFNGLVNFGFATFQNFIIPSGSQIALFGFAGGTGGTMAGEYQGALYPQ